MFSQAEKCFFSLIKLPACKNDLYGWQALGVVNLHKAHLSLQSSQVGAAARRKINCPTPRECSVITLGQTLLVQ